MPDDPDDRDDFEGIDIGGPWGGVRIGSGRARVRGRGGDWDDDDEVRAIRRRVHRQLDFYRHATFYVAVVGVLTLIDWLSGGGFWVQWLAVIWGAFLAVQGFGLFISPSLWGRDVEERMVERELRRRRGSVDASPPPPEREP